MNSLCVICARTGSKGLKNKNFLKIKGKTLIEHTIKMALKSKIFKNIVISIDKQNINLKSYKSKIIFIERPKKLAQNNSKKIDAIRHAVKFCETKTKLNYNYIFDLDVTSPLRNYKDIQKSFKKFKKNKSNNLISVTPSKKNPYFNMVEVKNKKVDLIKKTKKIISNRQKAPKTFDMNASIYIWRKEYLFRSYNLFDKKTSIYVMPPERSIDIDTDFDFRLVKHLFKIK
jgi:CMP-N,N'-diacetyllegionaminic acid synthase